MTDESFVYGRAMTEPTTEAGRRLLASFFGDRGDLRRYILAIESEARATAPAGRPDFAAILRNADAAMRDETGRKRSRTSYYWRDLADAIHAVWDKGHPDLRSGLTERGTDLASAIGDELQARATQGLAAEAARLSPDREERP